MLKTLLPLFPQSRLVRQDFIILLLTFARKGNGQNTRKMIHSRSVHKEREVLRWEFIKENKKVRKQENKNSTKKKRKLYFFLDRFLGRVVVFFFLVFFYKFPPQIFPSHLQHSLLQTVSLGKLLCYNKIGYCWFISCSCLLNESCDQSGNASLVPLISK